MDGSLAIIRKYADRLGWWVSEPDKGQADAINKGFQRASGEIIAWLNSDDMYAPGVFKEVQTVFSENPDIGMVYGKAVSIDQDGNPLNDLKIGAWSLTDLVSFHILCQPAVFLRRSVLEQVGYLDTGYHMMLDHHLWLRVAQRTKIGHVPMLWAFARHHAGAKNVNQAPKFGEEACKILNWMATQPDLATIFSENRRTVLARVHRFNGRYLLDGGLAWAALSAYARSFFYQPNIAIHEWHRIAYALLSLLGLGRLGQYYYQIKKRQVPKLARSQGIVNVHSLYSKT